MSGLKAYWASAESLRADQRIMLPAIEWLIDETDAPPVRRSGRTTVLATAFVRAACSVPGRKIRLFDHIAGLEHTRNMTRAVAAIIDQSRTEKWFKVNTGDRPYIQAQEGWGFHGGERFQRDIVVKRPTSESKAFATNEFAKESIVEDIRDVVRAALELGISAERILSTVEGAIVREVMEA